MEFVQTTDNGILLWLGGEQDCPWLHKAMEVFTFLGYRFTVIGVVVTAALIFWLYGRRRTACIVLAAAVLGLGIAQAVKFTVKRPRPDVAWRTDPLPPEPSFPSGHALNSMAIYGSIALTASRDVRRRSVRWLVLALGLGLPVVIGVSRAYLGVHYPSDVVAGWIIGLACALLAYWADQRWDRGTARASSLSSP